MTIPQIIDELKNIKEQATNDDEIGKEAIIEAITDIIHDSSGDEFSFDYDDEHYSGISSQTVTTPGSLENKKQSWKSPGFWNKHDHGVQPNEYGASVCEKDLMGATAQEILEIVEENPQGVAQYLHDLVYDDDTYIALNQMKEGN